jgi:hypothetical protein
LELWLESEGELVSIESIKNIELNKWKEYISKFKRQYQKRSDVTIAELEMIDSITPDRFIKWLELLIEFSEIRNDISNQLLDKVAKSGFNKDKFGDLLDWEQIESARHMLITPWEEISGTKSVELTPLFEKKIVEKYTNSFIYAHYHPTAVSEFEFNKLKKSLGLFTTDTVPLETLRKITKNKEKNRILFNYVTRRIVVGQDLYYQQPISLKNDKDEVELGIITDDKGISLNLKYKEGEQEKFKIIHIERDGSDQQIETMKVLEFDYEEYMLTAEKFKFKALLRNINCIIEKLEENVPQLMNEVNNIHNKVCSQHEIDYDLIKWQLTDVTNDSTKLISGIRLNIKRLENMFISELGLLEKIKTLDQIKSEGIEKYFKFMRDLNKLRCYELLDDINRDIKQVSDLLKECNKIKIIGDSLNNICDNKVVLKMLKLTMEILTIIPRFIHQYYQLKLSIINFIKFFNTNHYANTTN